MQGALFRRKTNRSHGFGVRPSDEARICTDCKQPPSCCEKKVCKRWQEERKKLLEKKNDGK